MKIVIHLFLFYFLKVLFIFREKGREGERKGEKCQYARETLIGSFHVLPRGDVAATQACALTRIEPVNFRFA